VAETQAVFDCKDVPGLPIYGTEAEYVYDDDGALTRVNMKPVVVGHEESHENCTVIIGYKDGEEVWRSHWSSEMPPELRIHPDVPADDYRAAKNRRASEYRKAPSNRDGAKRLTFRLPTDEELKLDSVKGLGWDASWRSVRAAHLARDGSLSQAEAARQAGVKASVIRKAVAALKSGDELLIEEGEDA
jgi:hypothetical protein